MRTPDELKKLLQEIKNSNFQISDNHEIDGVIADMLRHIGHPDPVFRDELIYSTFYEWTVNGVISAGQMKNMLNVCLDEQHLFYCIGESNTDSVFTRAFSVLIIPLALYMNQQNAFLTETDEITIKEAVIRYYRQEKDYRGYVEGKGWAHAIAHTADALDDIAKLGSMGQNELIEILDVMKELIVNGDSVYICEEDERIVTAFMSVYRRGILSDNDICSWLKRIERSEVQPFYNNQRVNQKNFLRSLYFRFLSQKDAEEICNYIAEIINSYEIQY